MKKYITAAALIALTFGSCAKLDVDVESQLSSGNFPASPDAFVAATGTVYQKFNAGFGVDIWRMYEVVITTREDIRRSTSTTGCQITRSFRVHGNGAMQE
jgi:hypothetical protein